MAADANGNDLDNVIVPLTGFVAVKLDETKLPTVSGTTLPTDYNYLGLMTQDGGPEESVEMGDELEFYQEGYSLRAGNESIAYKFTLTELNTNVLKLLGHTTSGSGSSATTSRTAVAYNGVVGLIWSETKRDTGADGTLKSYTYAALATVQEVARSASSRGDMDTYEITFKLKKTSGKWYDGPKIATVAS